MKEISSKEAWEIVSLLELIPTEFFKISSHNTNYIKTDFCMSEKNYCIIQIVTENNKTKYFLNKAGGIDE